MEKIKLLILDENMNTVKIELDIDTFRELNINAEKVSIHKSKTALVKTVNNFISESGN